MTTIEQLGLEIGRQPCRSDGSGGRIFTHGPLTGIRYRPYRATQPSKATRPCSRCAGTIIVGTTVWRGLPGLAWCCDRCGADEAHRILDAVARARAAAAADRRTQSRQERSDYRTAVRAGSLGRWRR